MEDSNARKDPWAAWGCRSTRCQVQNRPRAPWSEFGGPMTFDNNSAWASNPLAGLLGQAGGQAGWQACGHVR